MCGGHSYNPLDDILPPLAEDLIDNIGEESNDDSKMGHRNPRRFPTKKTDFQKFERKHQNRIIWQQRYLEVIRNCAIGLCAEYEQCLAPDEDVASLHKHDDIVNLPAAGSVANGKCTSSQLVAN